LIQWSPSLSNFHQKIIHTTFTSGDVIWKRVLDYFENLNVIPLGFDGSRNKQKRNGKFRRATEIFKKSEGGITLHPPLFEGYNTQSCRNKYRNLKL